MNKTPTTKPENPLVGQCFHSFEITKKSDGTEKRTIKWQGVVLATPLPGYYLVQLFEWMMGERICQHLVKIDDMLAWQFYDSAEDMRAYADRVRD